MATILATIRCWPAAPCSTEAETSTSSTRFSSRSSRNTLVKALPMREVTFQSIIRTSSPALYSRTSSNSMPWPRYTLR